MSAFFITATGTDIGKTFVTASLIRELRRRGRLVDALKPIVTGFDPAATESSDPAILLAALERPTTLEDIYRISPQRYRAPLSPDMAARAERRPVNLETLIGFCRKAIAAAQGDLLIEGVGGVMVPLNDRYLVLDWMVELALPLIVVAGSYLGTISHTLSALDVLARRKLKVRALVISETVGATVPPSDTLATLANFIDDVPLLAVPRLPNPAASHPTFGRLAEMVGTV